MEYSFKCYGHENIAAKHKTTLEFTKEREVSSSGDCIVGVNCDFSLEKIRQIIKDGRVNKELKDKIKIIIRIKNIEEEITGLINPDFNDDNEMVIRKSDYVSDRTLVIGADKGAFELNRDLIKIMKCENRKIEIKIQNFK